MKETRVPLQPLRTPVYVSTLSTQRRPVISMAELMHKGEPVHPAADPYAWLIGSSGRSSGVYGLFDPRDTTRIRYVGSSWWIQERLRQHRGAVATRWLDFQIQCVQLEKVDKRAGPRDLLLRERAWIDVLLRRGEADMNRVMP